MIGRRKVLLQISAAGLAVAAACVGARAEDTIKIGAAYELSGNFVSFGAAGKRGVELAADAFQGRVAGKPIEIVFKDNRSDAQTAASAINELLQHGVKYLVGPASSVSIAASIPAWRQSKPLWVASGATTAIEEQLGQEPNLYHIYPYTYDYQRATAAALKTILPAGAPIAVIYADDNYGRSSLAAVRKYVGEAGLKIVAEELIRPGANDLNPTLTKVRMARPQAVINLVQAADLITLAKQIQIARLNVPYLVSGGDVGSVEWQQSVGDAQEGWIGVTPFALGAQRAGDSRRADIFPPQDEWEKRFKDKYGFPPNWNDAAHYTAAAMLLLALDQAGGDDPQKVSAALNAMDVQTPMGRGKFEKINNTLHQAFSDALVFQRQGGRNVVIYPKDVATGAAKSRG
ncbi:ABC transporter substrate-binding protein [Bradyrhizobium sp. 31Argb]|uniref:ABC transporter substrate-binding protein n=1 Tax=Bradyrhizobium sp. 31Argb TaxID=3141247 RepID=UPI0037499E83